MAQHPIMFCMAATPFHKDGSLDEATLRIHLSRLAEAGVGIYLGAGGAGEGHALSISELGRVFEIGVEVCKGRVPTYATVPETRTASDAIEKCKVAAAAGVDAIQIFVVEGGHGMRPRPLELEHYYRDIFSAIDHPFAISAHMELGYLPPIQLLKALCKDYPKIVALNVIATPASYFLELHDELGPRMPLYTGMARLLEGMAMGASGCLAAEPNIIPRLCKSVVDAFESNELRRCAESFATVARFAAIVNRWSPSTARWVKMALHVLDLPGGNGVIRPPYLMPEQSELEEMAQAFARLRITELEARA